MTRADFADLREQLDQYTAELRRERTVRLGEKAVTWLALAPQWTRRLAEYCNFPAPKPLPSWIEDAVAAGLCQRQALLNAEDDGFDLDGDNWPDVRFWIPENERGDVLGDIRRRTALRKLAADIGNRIRSAPAEIERDPGLDRWADLAARGVEDARAGEWLMETVKCCSTAGKMAEALDWVYAAETLGPVLGEEVASAAVRAKRLINLEYRRRLDARFAAHFMRRQGQLEAVERLLSSRDGEPWALHFVGMGGVGKTTLIRYLSGAFTADGGRDIVVTRVDFDHISPRYPVEQPGQLLRELAGGLADCLVEADQVSAYGYFVECADVLDRVTAITPGRGGVRSVEFENALEAFASLVKAIKTRVVLILDTCEELAKLHPAGEPVPGVERTFEILERLHKKVDGIRAILAGRRLLAAEYANWRPPASSTPRQAWAVSLAKRGYLELFEVRGFTEAEARRFLSEVRKRKDQMPRDIQDAILQAAPYRDRIAGVMTADAPNAASPESEQLYNPYELDLYADWFEESEGALTAAEIESGNLDAYVEVRIIDRLPTEPPVRRVLPAIAILGRVDIHIVRMILASPEAVGDRVFRVLAEQEWIASRAAEESGVMVFEVQPGLLRRLKAYFGRPERVHEHDAALETLCRELPGLLRDRRPLDAAAVEHVAVAMRILPDEAALPLWDDLTDDILRHEQWAWAGEACARLLANDGDAGSPRPALAAAVRAVYIGALQRRDPAYDAAEDWAFVQAEAPQHPSEAAASALADRAALGIAAADARHRGRFARLEDGEPFTGAWSRAVAGQADGQCLAAALAVAEAFLDAGADEQSGTLLPVDDVRRLAALSHGREDPRLAAFAQVVVARTELRAGIGLPQFETAEQLAPASCAGPAALDWRLPRFPKARIRLQWLHASVGLPQSPPSSGVLQRWLEEALGCDDIEHERLASAVLLRLLASGPVDADLVRTLDGVVRGLPPLSPLCLAHLETPPLAASVVRAWLSLAEPGTALALIEAWEESSPTVERDAATIAHVRLATLHLVRRMRWRGLRDSLVLTLATGGSPELVFAARATQVLLGKTAETQVLLDKTSDEGIREEDLPAADIEWRTARALNARDVTTVLDAIAPRLDGDPADPVAAAHLIMDRQEAQRLGRRFGRSPSYQAAGDLSEAKGAIERRLTTGAGSLTVAAQQRAILMRQLGLSSHRWTRPGEARHDWAEAALEEGELLALRLPREGQRLLDFAAREFDEAGDLAAATIAGIRGVIARYHADDANGARVALSELRPRYDRLRALSDTELPAWDMLADWSRGRREDAAADGPWDGWLTRLAVCIAHSKEYREESAELVSELDLKPVPRRRTLLRLGLDAGKNVGQVALEVLVVYAAIGALALLGSSALSWLGWHLGTIAGLVVGLVAIVAALFVAALLIGVLASPLMDLIGAQFRLVASVEPCVSAAKSPDRAVLEIGLQAKRTSFRLAARYLVAFPQRRAVAELPLRPDPLRTSLPQEFTHALKRARTIHIGEVAFHIGAKAVPGAWEAALGLNEVTGSGRENHRYFKSFRVYPAPEQREHASSSHVAVLCARPFALFAEESWGAAEITPQVFHPEELRKFERGVAAGVLHLIGTPVPGELGPMLAFEGSGTLTVQPDRLPLSDSYLIVVQAEPTRSSVSVDARSDVVRGIAHDIAAASGGAAVIAIPALPHHLAVTLTEEIARALAGGPPQRVALLTLIQRLRTIVFDAGDPETAVATRILPAFDICLYMGE